MLRRVSRLAASRRAAAAVALLSSALPPPFESPPLSPPKPGPSAHAAANGSIHACHASATDAPRCVRLSAVSARRAVSGSRKTANAHPGGGGFDPSPRRPSDPTRRRTRSSSALATARTRASKTFTPPAAFTSSSPAPKSNDDACGVSDSWTPPSPTPPLPPDDRPRRALLAAASLARAVASLRRARDSAPSRGTTTRCTRPGNRASNARSSAAGSSVTHRGNLLNKIVVPATDAMSSARAYRMRTKDTEISSAIHSTHTIATAEVSTTAQRYGESFGRWCTVVLAKRLASSRFASAMSAPLPRCIATGRRMPSPGTHAPRRAQRMSRLTTR